MPAGETQYETRVMIRRLTVSIGVFGLGACLALSPAVKADPVIEAMQDYMMFQDYTAGIILPQQLDQSVFDAALFIDTRSEDQFAAGTIPGAINIEWRAVLDRIDDIPDSQLTILFCNSGSLSAQAVFALRVAGKSNVVVLQTGIDGWRQTGAYRPAR
jgi:rhodanese-related sulfurtransferase